jgi:DnaJ-class molecular chaperone
MTLTPEQAVMSCPQCEGEGGYPDGLDENACHTECTRCAGNGWIVDLTAMHRAAPAGITDEVVERVAEPYRNKWIGDHEEMIADLHAVIRSAALTVLLPRIDQEDQGHE